MMSRIVSLLPSATEIIFALGFGEKLVGRSHECDYPPEVKKIPVVTAPAFEVEGNSGDIDRRVRNLLERGLSLYRVDVSKLRALRPEVIVTQTQCEACAVSEAELAKVLSDWVGPRVQIVSLKAGSLQEIWEDFRRVGVALGDPGAAEDLIRKIQREMEGVVGRLPPTDRWPRVAAVEWLDPLMTAGNWMPELVALAGGIDLFGKEGHHSEKITWEILALRNPEVLIFLPCGFDMARTENEIRPWTQRVEWKDLKAVKENKVFLTDGNQYFNRPGPRVLDSLKILAEMLHPKIFLPEHQGAGWKPFPS